MNEDFNHEWTRKRISRGQKNRILIFSMELLSTIDTLFENFRTNPSCFEWPPATWTNWVPFIWYVHTRYVRVTLFEMVKVREFFLGRKRHKLICIITYLRTFTHLRHYEAIALLFLLLTRPSRILYHYGLLIKSVG